MKQNNNKTDTISYFVEVLFYVMILWNYKQFFIKLYSFIMLFYMYKYLESQNRCF